MTMKETVENILGKFLERNREYAVGGYIRNGVNGNDISNFLIPIDRKIEINTKKISIISNANEIKSINTVSVPYDDVLACYEERDEYNQQMVYVILKNGMKIEFECVGLRM